MVIDHSSNLGTSKAAPASFSSSKSSEQLSSISSWTGMANVNSPFCCLLNSMYAVDSNRIIILYKYATGYKNTMQSALSPLMLAISVTKPTAVASYDSQTAS